MRICIVQKYRRVGFDKKLRVLFTKVKLSSMRIPCGLKGAKGSVNFFYWKKRIFYAIVYYDMRISLLKKVSYYESDVVGNLSFFCDAVQVNMRRIRCGNFM